MTSTARQTLQPQDSAELLQTSAWVRQQSGDEGKRDLILCLERHVLLLATSDGAPLRLPSTEGGRLLAFTDDEAFTAWRDRKSPAMPECTVRLSSEERPRSERDGRRRWLELFESCDASAVIINPAGPLGFAAYQVECRTARPRLRRRGPEGTEEAWLDARARAAERARVQRFLEDLSEAIQTRDDARFDSLRPEIAQVNRLHAPSIAAATEVLSGRWRINRGERKDGIFQLLWGSYAWSRYVGDPYRCIDGVVEGANLLLGLQPGIGGGEESGWIAGYLEEAAGALTLLRPLAYREREIDDILAAARDGSM